MMSPWDERIRSIGARVQGLGRALEQPGRLRRRLTGIHLDEEVLAFAARPYVAAADVRTVFDVGANEGQFARTALKAFPAARLICFEPLQSAQQALGLVVAENRGRVEVENVALGDRNGEVDFNVATFSPSSSVLPLDQQDVVAIEMATTTRVPIRRLSDWAATKSIEREIIVKLDVQGYEAPVLRGAVDLLKKARVVIAETCFAPLYKGQATLGELCAILEPIGLLYREAFGVIRDARSAEPLWQDSVFVRR